MKIAVYTTAAGELVPFREAEIVTVYERASGWKASGILKLPNTGQTGSLAAMRRNAEHAARVLSGCEIIAGASLSGIAYHVFDSKGYKIFEVETLGDPILDAIEADATAEGIGVEVAPSDMEPSPCGGCFPTLAHTEPVETTVTGVYTYNLAEAMARDPALTSKKALLGFVNQSGFDKLILLCTHIPPWLERGNYAITTEKNTDGTLTAVITSRRPAET